MALVRKLFKTDPELVHYHVLENATIDQCTERTYKDLNNLGDAFEFYVIEDKDPIGFFGVETHGTIKSLTSFFITPDYRNRGTVSYFWSAVNNTMSGPYLCGIYEKNTRARTFLEKQGKLLTTVPSSPPALIFGFNLGV